MATVGLFPSPAGLPLIGNAVTGLSMASGEAKSLYSSDSFLPEPFPDLLLGAFVRKHTSPHGVAPNPVKPDWRGPWDLRSEGGWTAITQVGNPTLGSILHVKQAHGYDGLKKQNRKLYQLVVQNQLDIYRSLLDRLAPAVLFQESLHVDLTSSELRKGKVPLEFFEFQSGGHAFIKPDHERRYFLRGRELFGGGMRKPVTEEQRRWIVYWGAAYAYAFSREGVLLKKTCTPDEAGDFLLFLKANHLEQSPRLPNDAVLFSRRENALAWEVRNFMALAANRPCNVVILFGYEHDFSRAFEKIGFMPHVQILMPDWLKG